MPAPTPENLKKFLVNEIMAGPLAEFLPGEPFRLYLDQYLSAYFKGQELPLEVLAAWMEGEYGAPSGTVQLIFERLQAKGKKLGFSLLLPGQKPVPGTAPAAAAAPDQPEAGEPALSEEAPVPAPASRFTPKDLIKVLDRNALYKLPLTNREKSVLIFMDGRNNLDQLNARTKVPVPEIQEFLEKYWDSHQFQLVEPGAKTDDPKAADSKSSPPPAQAESITYDDSMPLKYDRREKPAPSKAAPAKSQPSVKAPSAPAGSGISNRTKILLVAVGVGLVLSVSFALYFFVLGPRSRKVEIKKLDAAKYSTIFVLVQAEKADTVFRGVMQSQNWSRLSKEEKLEKCRLLFRQVKSENMSQIQLRDNNGEYLALVHNEEQISIMR